MSCVTHFHILSHFNAVSITDTVIDAIMATSSRISANPNSPKSRGWFSTGRKVTVTPSRNPVHVNEDEGVYSSGPTKQMKQIRKSKSEKEKMKIYASAQELGPRNTKWHISLPNIHDTREITSRNLKSPIRSPKSSSPLPPPPSNPPPVLQAGSSPKTGRPKGRELVKSVSAGAINVINPATRGQGRLLSPHGSPPVKPAVGAERKTPEETVRQRRPPPPQLLPPSPAKARAATVISAAIQEHIQLSTRSAPGDLQQSPESEKSPKSSADSPGRVRSESSENAVIDTKEISKPQPPKKPEITPQASNDEESPLTASVEGGVKSLARYFSARSKESLKTQPPSPKQNPMLRQVEGRRAFKSGLQKVKSIPEEDEKSDELEGRKQKPRLPPIRSISNDQDDRLHSVASLASPGSPTHMSLFSWYNSGPEAKVDPATKAYQNVFDDKAFAVFDKTGATRKESESSSTSPKSPNYKAYQNILVETATLVGEAPASLPSPQEGSHKDKKPVPLPRTQSKEKGMEHPRIRERHLATSDSDISLPVPSPQSSLTNRISDYIHMAIPTPHVADSHEASRVSSPGMVVFGALDPEWRDNFEELIEREIEMTEGFSDSDTNEETEDSQEQKSGVPIVPPPPFVPTKKAALKKTQSHNPNGPNIQRRNTPKEKRELRKGVCSESDQLEKDEYIPMQPPVRANNTPLPSQNGAAAMTSSLTVPQPPPGMDPRSSTYYLKILPSPMVKPPEEGLKAAAPAPAKHFYIEIDVPGDPSKDGVTQGEQDESKSEALPTELSPVHTPSSTPVVEANRKRKLKYPKISLGASANSGVPGVPEARKTPYSKVKVDGQSESETERNSHPAVARQRSQGSIFAKEMLSYVHRPLPPTPAQGAVYYKTVNHPLSHIPAMRQVWHHEYIEIDESELNQKNKEAPPKAAEGWINIHTAGGPVRVGETKPRSLTNLPPPPPVPQRPSCPYVEIDADEMGELAASLPLSSRFRVAPGPKMARKLGPPPVVPGRPEETIRQRSLSSSGEYSYPLIPGLMFEWLTMKKSGGNEGYFSPQFPLPTSKPSQSGKKSLMETITEKGSASDSPPTVPPKTESLLREQMRLLANQPTRTRPSPYLVPVTSVRRESPKESSYDHLSSEPTYPPQGQPKSPKEVISNLRRELLSSEDNGKGADDHKVDKSSMLPPHLRERKKSMAPPSPPLPYQSSVEAKEKAMSRHPPKVPKKKKKVNRGTSAQTTETIHAESRVADKDESTTSADSPPESVALRKARLQDRIDRNSLAMIMRNKSAIAEMLEKENDSPKARRKQMQANASKDGESVVRSLGDILLDVDALLQNQMCSEDDLIAAIEKQLNIKLVKKLPGERSRGDKGEASSIEDSVQVTEQDVKEVVQFMNDSQDATQPESRQGERLDTSMESSMIVKTTEEEESSERELMGSPKRRSSTVIITEDPADTSEAKFLTDKQQLSPDDWDHNKEEEAEENQMRDSRSSSVGLKPLRRVKARRKTNPASDMANLSVGK